MRGIKQKMPYASKEDRAQWFRDWRKTPQGQAHYERRLNKIRLKRKLYKAYNKFIKAQDKYKKAVKEYCNNERKSKTVKAVKTEFRN